MYYQRSIDDAESNPAAIFVGPSLNFEADKIEFSLVRVLLTGANGFVG